MISLSYVTLLSVGNACDYDVDCSWMLVCASEGRVWSHVLVWSWSASSSGTPEGSRTRQIQVLSGGNAAMASVQLHLQSP
eukprot:CAMPEP_0119374300 /NCGR_PEP_ID=MMETSP1334-20130426/30512_1 /TAXON_ID=127549 /ORGANISM="Calcidiscus leptoporus, Strain RCC1130" /LENGTH=79 /DNA_ID=CAMNT_0007392335 /DNA_START=65 /DNA_END=300 /DNA_ORIENTATION=+